MHVASPNYNHKIAHNLKTLHLSTKFLIILTLKATIRLVSLKLPYWLTMKQFVVQEEYILWRMNPGTLDSTARWRKSRKCGWVCNQRNFQNILRVGNHHHRGYWLNRNRILVGSITRTLLIRQLKIRLIYKTINSLFIMKTKEESNHIIHLINQ